MLQKGMAFVANDPKLCSDPRCRDTNWQGHNRVHEMTESCPGWVEERTLEQKVVEHLARTPALLPCDRGYATRKLMMELLEENRRLQRMVDVMKPRELTNEEKIEMILNGSEEERQAAIQSAHYLYGLGHINETERDRMIDEA